MKFIDLYEATLNVDGKTLYHVTRTEKVGNIKKEGLTLKNETNWVKSGNGQRYGKGEVYAFEKEIDAWRWALKMDWEFNKSMGSGKISVVSFKAHGKWTVDESDPLSQANHKGKWLKSKEAVPPEDIIDAEEANAAKVKELRPKLFEYQEPIDGTEIPARVKRYMNENDIKYPGVKSLEDLKKAHAEALLRNKPDSVERGLTYALDMHHMSKEDLEELAGKKKASNSTNPPPNPNSYATKHKKSMEEWAKALGVSTGEFEDWMDNIPVPQIDRILKKHGIDPSGDNDDFPDSMEDLGRKLGVSKESIENMW